MSSFKFPGQSAFYQGKVRDVYTIEDRILVMIASDRISAFDVILPRTIPHKGQVLNQIAADMLKRTQDICRNWLLDTPTASSSVGLKCTPFKIEMVVRGHLSGHIWRTYSSGKRELSGVIIPEGLRENDPFDHPLVTPSTKANEGHDEDISREEIIKSGLATAEEWEQLESLALALFKRGQELAQQRNLILADTKYEFGKYRGEIVLMDEIHTPDSSRYFYASGFESRQEHGEKQKQLSKEFVREWLISHDFMGKEGQQLPAMSDEWVNTISGRYIELYELLTGKKFQPEVMEPGPMFEKISQSVENIREKF